MKSIPTGLTVCLYALILGLVFLMATLACFLSRKYITHAKVTSKLADFEANTVDQEQQSTSPRLVTLPDNFHLDPIVYPSAARRPSRRLSSSQRVIPNAFASHSYVNEPPAAIKGFMLEARADEVDGGNNGDNHSHLDDGGERIPPVLTRDLTTDPTPSPPCRPPLLDDLLTRFSYEQDVAQDIWFPLLNSETGRWELGVVMGPRRVSSCPQQYDVGRALSAVVVAPEEMGEAGDEEDKTRTIVAFSIDEDEVDYTPLDSNRKKTRRSRIHMFEIPELYVNARAYEEIEAEEARAAGALAATVEGDERIEVDTEEEEALTAHATAAHAARDTR